MTERNNIFEQLKEWLDTLTPSERSDVREIWEEAEQVDEAANIPLTDEEKRQSLTHIRRELGLDGRASDPASGEARTHDASTSKVQTLGTRFWIAAAATILIAAGVSYLLLPVSHTASLGKQAVVTLPDGSRVTLNSGSTISYSRLFSYTGRQTELNGEAFFEVEPGQKPFTVHTFNASVRVLGTKFNLRAWSPDGDTGSETEITLTEGRLSFEPSAHPENAVVLEPGQKSTLRAGRPAPDQPDRAHVKVALSWMENRFSFEKRPLRQIINELERRYDLDIRVAGDASTVLSDSLTIYYSNPVEAEQIVRDICLSTGLKYRPVNNGYVIE